jgi:hypothetical protein
LRLIKALFDSNSRYAVLMATSLFGLDDRINHPGTTGGTNWRFRLPWTHPAGRRETRIPPSRRAGRAREIRSRRTDAILDRILILFGLEILKIVPGRVSTEVDARLSFDTQGTIDKARQFIAAYEKEGQPAIAS